VVELPAGSVERGGVVNLVDADAAAELDAFLLDHSLIHPTARHALTKSLNLFLEHYEEQYDFVYFFTDHPVPKSGVAGKFEHVTTHAAPGGVLDFEIAAEGYETTGRVQGVAVFPYAEGGYPPLAHETMHDWGVYLDPKFGFGTGFDASSSTPLHWGYVSVNGQLGGFDASTLRCQTPANAKPPNCTPLAGGRTVYTLGPFGASANSFRNVPYAPLELYLMGLLPAADVPPTIQELTAAKSAVASADQKSVTVEAAGVTTIKFADIQARHGVIAERAKADRSFSSAFVVLSKAPVAAAVLDAVAGYAAVFGNRKAFSGAMSFEEATGGRATMKTVLGPRRHVDDAPPAPRAALTCDTFAQNCQRPELACVLGPPIMCALPGTAKLGKTCVSSIDCERGLGCVSGNATPDVFVCQPFCDPASTTSASACSKCAHSYVSYQDKQGNISGVCSPN
jgi:hypothetical protein